MSFTTHPLDDLNDYLSANGVEVRREMFRDAWVLTLPSGDEVYVDGLMLTVAKDIPMLILHLLEPYLVKV